MRKFSDYVENIGGGLPGTQPNYNGSARPIDPNHSGTIDVGQAHVHLVGPQLMIDTSNHSIAIPLNPEQIKMLLKAFE